MKKHIAAALLAGIAAVSLSPAMANAAPVTMKGDPTITLSSPHAGEGILPCNTYEWKKLLESAQNDPDKYDTSDFSTFVSDSVKYAVKYMGCSWNDFFAGRGVNDQSNRPTPVDALKSLQSSK